MATVFKVPSGVDPNTNPLRVYLSQAFTVAGSFGMGVTAVAATKAAVGNWDPVETAVIAGVAGNSLTFALTAGGGPACRGTFAMAHYDSTLQTRTCATGWTVYILPGSATGDGVQSFENATLKTLTIIYEAGVSTRAHVDQIINATNYIYVAVAGAATATIAASEGTSVALSDTPAACAGYTASTTAAVVYFTNALTTITLAKAAAAAHPNLTAAMTLVGGTGATVLVTGDAFVAGALSGGVDAVAISNIRGKGFTVAKTGVGVYTVTMERWCYRLLGPKASIQLAVADDKHVQIGTLTQPVASTKAPGYFTIGIWDVSGAAAAEVAVNNNNRINFSVVCEDSQYSEC